jgi:hypothetical protein
MDRETKVLLLQVLLVAVLVAAFVLSMLYLR